MAEIEPCTTEAKRLRHWSVLLVPSRRVHRKGRAGRTLCGNYGRDEEWVNADLAYWGSSRRVAVADLPECKKCAQAKAKRERESGPDREVA